MNTTTQELNITFKMAVDQVVDEEFYSSRSRIYCRTLIRYLIPKSSFSFGYNAVVYAKAAFLKNTFPYIRSALKQCFLEIAPKLLMVVYMDKIVEDLRHLKLIAKADFDNSLIYVTSPQTGVSIIIPIKSVETEEEIREIYEGYELFIPKLLGDVVEQMAK